MSETKGITVKVPIELHAEVRAHLAATGKTMNEFVAEALKDELHPKHQIMENKNMEKMRTLALQVPESLFQKIKGYLERNNLTQKDFVLGLIERELEREQAEIAENSRDNERNEEVDEEEQEEKNLGESGADLEKEEETLEEESQGGPIMGGM